MTVLVTGANGFVGSALCQRLIANGQSMRAAVRSLQMPVAASGTVEIGSINATTDWSRALLNAHSVVHLAARVHVMDERSLDSLSEFRVVNVDGTLNLARQAAAAGVRRFVFLSSVKVNGESTQAGHAFSASDIPSPEDPYSISKYEAEQGLLQIAQQTGMEVVIIRPPLVYGPGVKANFERMIRWLDRGIPLPFGAVCNNRRSLVALDNLVDLLCLCLKHPAAVGQILMVSDGEDLSTADLLRRLAYALGVRPHLVSVPPGLLTLGASLLGQEKVAQRLLGNLQVDILVTCDLLNWRPPLTVDQGLQRATQGWKR